MNQKNSPDARRALYLNQAEGLLQDTLRFQFVQTTRTKPYLPKDFTPVAGPAGTQSTDQKSVRQWLNSWRARLSPRA